MKVEWKIFKKLNFYYFKLNEYSHILAINYIDYPNEYACNVEGACYRFSVSTNTRNILKTLVPFLQYAKAMRDLAKRITK